MITAENDSVVREVTEENAEVLEIRINAIFQDAPGCQLSPGEKSALKVCDDSRLIWDIVEGMLLKPIDARSIWDLNEDILQKNVIPRELLARAIRGIDEAITAVTNMVLPQGTPDRARVHVTEIIEAMTARRDDLTVLLQEGKIAFFSRLRDRREGKEL